MTDLAWRWALYCSQVHMKHEFYRTRACGYACHQEDEAEPECARVAVDGVSDGFPPPIAAGLSGRRYAHR